MGELAEYEEQVEFLPTVANIGLLFFFMLINNPKVQELAVDAGVTLFQFIADHVKDALNSGGDVNEFIRRAARRKTEMELAEHEEEVRSSPELWKSSIAYSLT